MNTSLTIRLPAKQRQALRRRAKSLNKSESEWLRELIARNLDDAPLGERLQGLSGSLESAKRTRPSDPHPMKEQLRQRNWRKA